jgi:hypothetical protein
MTAPAAYFAGSAGSRAPTHTESDCRGDRHTGPGRGRHGRTAKRMLVPQHSDPSAASPPAQQPSRGHCAWPARTTSRSARTSDATSCGRLWQAAASTCRAPPAGWSSITAGNDSRSSAERCDRSDGYPVSIRPDLMPLAFRVSRRSATRCRPTGATAGAGRTAIIRPDARPDATARAARPRPAPAGPGATCAGARPGRRRRSRC